MLCDVTVVHWLVTAVLQFPGVTWFRTAAPILVSAAVAGAVVVW